MAKTYKTYLPEQDLLLPPSLRDWLPENHLAYCVSDVVDQLDLSAIESVYEEHDDEDAGVWLLRGSVFLSPDSETSGGRRGFPGIGSRISGP